MNFIDTTEFKIREIIYKFIIYEDFSNLVIYEKSFHPAIYLLPEFLRLYKYPGNKIKKPLKPSTLKRLEKLEMIEKL